MKNKNRIEDGVMYIISKKHGQFKVLIDEADTLLIAPYRWCVGGKEGNRYVVTNIGGKLVRLHRFLMNPPADMVVDHKNGDPFDNRRDNLRVVTQLVNTRNRKKKSPGYCFHKTLGKWVVRVRHQGKIIYGGYFDTEDRAKMTANLIYANIASRSVDS